MSFAGHVLDSIKRLESNRKLRKSSSLRIKERYGSYVDAPGKSYNPDAVKHKSEVEKQAFRDELLMKRRKRARTTWTFTLLVFFALVATMLLLWLR